MSDREIKLRVWDKQQKIWRNAFYFDIVNGKPTGNINPDFFIFQQFTGLKDKNGKEIYEGDILFYDSPVSEGTCRNTCRGKVVWYDNFCWAFRYDDVNDVWFMNSDFDFRKINIIGNFFENPGLLKNYG